CPLEQNRCRRRLRDEGERAIVIDRHHHRDDESLQFLRAGARIELLAELHDVDLRLSEGRTYRRRRGSLSRGDLQLHRSCDLLCHSSIILLLTKACAAPKALTHGCLWLRDLLHLIKLELDRRRSPENRDHHL